jgi:hypothetical protein
VLRYPIRLIIVLGTCAVFVAAAYSQEHLFAVNGVVVDQSGAGIQQAEAVFKGESGTIVAHSDANGSVNVNLKAGSYVVTVTAHAFATAKLIDFSVPDPTANAFRVVLKIDQSQVSYGSDLGQSSRDRDTVPTVPSELTNSIEDEPTRTSSLVVRSVTTKHRSMQCLYLWRCSASQP